MKHAGTNIARTIILAAPLLCAALPAAAGATAYVTNQGDGVTLIDTATLTAGRRVELPNSDPRGLAVTPDGKYLLTANQKSGDVAVIDTGSLQVSRRIPIGKNPEFLRILPDGSKAFVTYEPGVKSGPPGKEGKDDDSGPQKPAEVAVIDLKTWKVIASIVGAPETEGIEFTPDGKRIAITNEGDDTVTVYDIATAKLVLSLDLRSHGHRPRGIKLAPDGRSYIVTMENSNNFLVLDAEFKLQKSVPTAMGPYGVAFDRSGRRIVIAASRDSRLQVFDASSYARIADIPVGKRCWHFSFTPDESKLLVACGRSNDVEVVDAATYQVIKTLPGFQQPWGIVTYPKAYGSLEAAAKP